MKGTGCPVGRYHLQAGGLPAFFCSCTRPCQRGGILLANLEYQIIAALGSAVGSSVTYWLVRLGGRPAVDRVAHWFRLDPRHLVRAEAQFHRWGPALVLFGRVRPIVRVVVTLPAGLARMPFRRFFTYTFIGAYVWCTLLIGLGYTVGDKWPLISDLVKQFAPWFLAALVALGGLGWLGRRLIQQRLRPALAPVRADDGD